MSEGFGRRAWTRLMARADVVLQKSAIAGSGTSGHPAGARRNNTEQHGNGGCASSKRNHGRKSGEYRHSGTNHRRRRLQFETAGSTGPMKLAALVSGQYQNQRTISYGAGRRSAWKTGKGIPFCRDPKLNKWRWTGMQFALRKISFAGHRHLMQAGRSGI